MDGSAYVHGYAPEEQARLVAQAEYWRDPLILPGLHYRAGERLLEIGCAAGATLGVLVHAFPGLRLAGVDLEPRQIDFARVHLAALGAGDADLRVADATALPWTDASFDHVYIIWLLEHVADARPILREALRVLRPGGSIVVTETDYSTFRTYPESDAWDYLQQAQYDLFAQTGNPIIGRMLGALLGATGFTEVRSAACGFHFFNGPRSRDLRGHVEYISRFLEPMIERMAASLARDPARLRSGLAFFRSLADHPEGAFTQIVYRATAVKGETGQAGRA